MDYIGNRLILILGLLTIYCRDLCRESKPATRAGQLPSKPQLRPPLSLPSSWEWWSGALFTHPSPPRPSFGRLIHYYSPATTFTQTDRGGDDYDQSTTTTNTTTKNCGRFMMIASDSSEANNPSLNSLPSVGH